MSDTLGWDFDIDGDTEGADRLLRTLERMDKTIDRLDKRLEAMGDATDAVGKKHKKHQEHAEGLMGALRRLKDAALEPLLHKMKEYAEFEFVRKGVDALIELPEAIIDKLKELGEEMVNVAAKTERTNKAFGLLFGGDEGKENLEYAEQIAKYTEFTDDHVKNAMLSLGKVGFKGDAMDRALAAAHDMAAFSANPEEGFSEAISSLSRIKRTGRIDNRVLGGLGIGEKDFFGELAKRTGQSAAALKKAMDKGTLDTEDAIETLYTMISKKTGKDLGGAGVEMSKGLSAMLTHLKDLPEQYFQKLADSPGLEHFKEGMSHVLDSLDPSSPDGQRIYGAIEDAFNEVGGIVKDIDWAGGIREIASDIAPVLSAFREVAHVVGEIRDVIAEADYAMKSFAHDYTPLGFLQDHGIISAPQRMMPKRIKDAIAADVNAPGVSLPAPGAMSRSLSSEWMSGFEEVGSTGMKGFESGFRTTGRTHSPSDAMKDVGRDLADGLSLGFGAGMDGVASPAAGAFGGAGGAARAQVHITVPISVESAGGDGEALAERVAQRLVAIVPDALTSALERTSMEAGG